MAPKARKIPKVRDREPARPRPTSICIDGQEYDLVPKGRPSRTIAEVRTMMKNKDLPSVLASKLEVPLTLQQCALCGWGLEEVNGYIRCMNVGCGHIQRVTRPPQ